MGRVVGPLSLENHSAVHISPFGIIPKKAAGKWRLIADLSSPPKHSVNDGIARDLASLEYITVDDAAEALVRKGEGALLAKVDIKHVYRNIPVHPDDRWLLGMVWSGALFMHCHLVFDQLARFIMQVRTPSSGSLSKLAYQLSFTILMIFCSSGHRTPLSVLRHYRSCSTRLMSWVYQ